MKKSMLRKVLLLACSAVLLVCLSVGATLAYLTSTTENVVNTFTVGKVLITLDEAKVDVYGVATGTDLGQRVTANTYKLIPGHNYKKDPTVHVDSASEDCWLFVKVENEIADIEDKTTTADQMTALGWTLVADTNNVYAYKDIVSGGTDVPVFGSFTIKGDAAVGNYEGKTIKIIAYAIQADGFNNAAAAWAAYSQSQE